MKSIVFVLLFLVAGYSQNLDSLVNKGKVGVKRNLQGLIFSKSSKTVETPKITKSAATKNIEVFVDNDNEAKIESLEINVAKLSVICENLQKQSDTHADNQDLFLKLIEALGSGLIAIVIALISKKLKLKGD
jgi:hypothetical protein